MKEYLLLEYSGRAKFDICSAFRATAGVRSLARPLSPRAGGRRKASPSRSDGGRGDCPSEPPRSSSGCERVCAGVSTVS